jgi:hypothetical protein
MELTTRRALSALDEFAAMTIRQVERRAAELPHWPRRRFIDWLMERGRDSGTDESEGDLWRRLAKRMRETRAAVVADLGQEVEEEWHPRLATEYYVRDRDKTH